MKKYFKFEEGGNSSQIKKSLGENNFATAEELHKLFYSDVDYSTGTNQLLQWLRSRTNLDWSNQYWKDTLKPEVYSFIFGNSEPSYSGGKMSGGGAKTHAYPESELVTDTIWQTIPIVSERTFNDAFGEARRNGLDKFQFNGKWYGTNLATDKEQGKAAQKAGNKRKEYNVEDLLQIKQIRKRPKTEKEKAAQK